MWIKIYLCGLSNHTHQAKNGQPAPRYFPSSSLGNMLRKLQLPETDITSINPDSFVHNYLDRWEARDA